MSEVDSRLSPVEAIKENSHYLRGSLAEELQNNSDCFDKDSLQLLKFHGSYQQDDRDARAASRDEGGGKAYSMMVRSRVPGGRLTMGQLLAHVDMCDQLGNTTLKITSRQGLQLHGILKKNLRETIHWINKIQLSTLAACGDVNRNVMCCPAKRFGGVHSALQHLTDGLVKALEPRSHAYYELWVTDLDGEEHLVGGGAEDTNRPAEEVEPVYGKTYLPRKFKIGIARASDNCIDVYTHDIGFISVEEGERLVGYNVIVGGGLGTTPSAAKTFPALAKRLAFVSPEDAVDLAVAIVKTQRDHGNRGDRKRARLKYLVHDWGIDRFREAVEQHYGKATQPCTPDDVHGFDDHLGWQAQGDGRWTYGLNVENGRLSDAGDRKWKAMLRAIGAQFGDRDVRLTAHQSVLFCDFADGDRQSLEGVIKQHGVPLSEEISEVRRWSMACVGLPTCGLSVTESERALPQVIDELEGPLARLGLQREAFTVRMTGCPNGCARPYNADVGLVGKTKGKYTVFLGGRLLGNRLAYIYKDLVPFEQLSATLVEVLTVYKLHRQPEETVGDFCDRVGKDQLTTWVVGLSA